MTNDAADLVHVVLLSEIRRRAWLLGIGSGCSVSGRLNEVTICDSLLFMAHGPPIPQHRTICSYNINSRLWFQEKTKTYRLALPDSKSGPYSTPSDNG